MASDWAAALKAREWDGAIALLDAALAEVESGSGRYGVPPDQLHFAKSITYASARRVKPSMESCLCALQLQPRKAKYWESLGKLLLAAHREGLANKCFDQGRALRRRSGAQKPGARELMRAVDGVLA